MLRYRWQKSGLDTRINKWLWIKLKKKKKEWKWLQRTDLMSVRLHVLPKQVTHTELNWWCIQIIKVWHFQVYNLEVRNCWWHTEATLMIFELKVKAVLSVMYWQKIYQLIPANCFTIITCVDDNKSMFWHVQEIIPGLSHLHFAGALSIPS